MARTTAEITADLSLTATAKGPSATCGSTTDLLADHRMITLWQRMSDLYGHRWASAYGAATQTRRAQDAGVSERLTPTVRAWQSALRGITPAELRTGLAACVRAAEEWPPSAPRFRARCRPPRQPYERAEFQGNALPHKPASREFALRQIAHLRNRSQVGSHE